MSNMRKAAASKDATTEESSSPTATRDHELSSSTASSLMKLTSTSAASTLHQQPMLRRVLATMVIFSIGMITLPLTSYFVFHHLSHGSTVMGATAAIITVHIILAGFVYKALTESQDDYLPLQKAKTL